MGGFFAWQQGLDVSFGGGLKVGELINMIPLNKRGSS